MSVFNGFMRVVFRIGFVDMVPASKDLPQNSHFAIRGRRLVVCQRLMKDPVSEEMLQQIGERLRNEVADIFGVDKTMLRVNFKKGVRKPELDYLMSNTERAMISDFQTVWSGDRRLRPYSNSKKFGVLVCRKEEQSADESMAQVLDEVRKDVVETYGLIDDSLTIEPISMVSQPEVRYLITDKVPEKPCLALGDTVWTVSKVEDKKSKSMKSYVAEKKVRVMELMDDGSVVYTAGSKKELSFQMESDGTFMAIGFRKPVYTEKAIAETQAAKGSY